MIAVLLPVTLLVLLPVQMMFSLGIIASISANLLLNTFANTPLFNLVYVFWFTNIKMSSGLALFNPVALPFNLRLYLLVKNFIEVIKGKISLVKELNISALLPLNLYTWLAVNCASLDWPWLFGTVALLIILVIAFSNKFTLNKLYDLDMLDTTSPINSINLPLLK